MSACLQTCLHACMIEQWFQRLGGLTLHTQVNMYESELQRLRQSNAPISELHDHTTEAISDLSPQLTALKVRGSEALH